VELKRYLAKITPSYHITEEFISALEYRECITLLWSFSSCSCGFIGSFIRALHFILRRDGAEDLGNIVDKNSFFFNDVTQSISKDFKYESAQNQYS